MKSNINFNKNTIKRLFNYLKNYKLKLTIVVISILISSISGVIGSMFLQVLIDDYITPMTTSINPNFTNLLNAIIIMAGIYLIGIITSYLYCYLMVGITQGILKNVRNQMFSHMQTLPLNYFDNNKHGDIMSHYTNDVDSMENLFSNALPQFLSSIVSIISVFIAMVYLSLHLTLLIIVVLILMLFVTKKLGGKSAIYFKKNQESIANINGYIEEIISGQKVVKVFNHEEIAKSDFAKLNNELFENNYNANKYANIVMPIMGNISNIQYVLIAIIGGILAVNNIGGLTLGIIASFLQLSKSFSMPISRLSQQINNIVWAFAGAERIFKLLDEKKEIDKGTITLVNVKEINNCLVETNDKTNLWAWKKTNEKDFEYIPLKGDVRFNNVNFGYTKEKTILHDITLYAKPGQKIAFVGATGAGKTTITNLINRFYEINEGEITYDGINIKEIKKSDLRKSLAIVLQDTNLFTGTIMENIKYGNENASDEEVYAAARLANADSFIKRLPEGYNTIIDGNASNLSQGQKQLLSIARAALMNPPVMILDEATSSIDTRTEKIIQDGMDKLMENRTVFVIAHRLSTIRNSKAIMVLENGKIIERGSHEELINEQGKYYQLYNGLFELE